MIELKPCPFCNTVPKIERKIFIVQELIDIDEFGMPIYKKTRNKITYGITCNNPKCPCVPYVNGNSLEESINEWNERGEPCKE